MIYIISFSLRIDPKVHWYLELEVKIDRPKIEEKIAIGVVTPSVLVILILRELAKIYPG